MSPSSIWLTHAMQGRARRTATLLLTAAVAALLAALALPAGAHAEGAPPVSVSALSPAEVETLLSGIPLEDLPATQLSELLCERLSESPTGGLEDALTEAIAGLAGKGGTLGQLAGSSELTSELEGQLKKLPPLERLSLEGLLGVSGSHTLSTVLSEALGSLEGRQVVGALLTEARETGEPTGPERSIEEVLSAPSPQKLEELLGGTLTSEPFSLGTVEGLASQEGTTPEELAKAFDATSEQLPASAMALTAPLSDGKTLGVLDAAEGIDVGTLTHELPGGSGGSGGSGGGTGGPGGDGGAGASSGAPGETPIASDPYVSGGASPSAKAASARVEIVSRRVKGDVIVLVVRAPAAGSVTVAGKGVKSASRQTDEAERVTVRAILTKAELALLRKGHRRSHIKLEVSFEPVSGTSSTATTSVTVH
jgi:hypothetical protein